MIMYKEKITNSNEKHKIKNKNQMDLETMLFDGPRLDRTS